MSDRDPLLGAADQLAKAYALATDPDSPFSGAASSRNVAIWGATAVWLRETAERHVVNPDSLSDPRCNWCGPVALPGFFDAHWPCPDRQSAEKFAAVVLGQ